MGETGYCGTDADYSISSITIHKGEEPVISGPTGICNIFFTGCNLKCIYCQNYQISRNDSLKKPWQQEKIIVQIKAILKKGVKAVGFVSSSHVVPQVISIIDALHKTGLYPITVYNTNGYEKPETIKKLEELIDVFLPDFKYISPSLSKAYSDAPDYFHFAAGSIKEMYRQKGSHLFVSDEGQAENGLLIRHLVLPGHSNESKKVLKYIAEEISPGVNLSLMSQYFPADKAVNHKTLNRKLYLEEYESVVEEMYRLGFRNGWVQEMESPDHYKPDFKKDEPFE
ncbi:MAG: radical SAM protein [Bacteroidota bacterium]